MFNVSESEFVIRMDRNAFDRIPSYKPQPDEPQLPVIVVTENAPVVTTKGRAWLADQQWNESRIAALRSMMTAARSPFIHKN